MASKTIITITDDMDGTEGAETIEFALDGTSYSIDLSDKNAEAMRKVFAPYIEAGRKAGNVRSMRRTTAAPKAGAAAAGFDPTAVREWAKANKVEVPVRGRVPKTVVDLYAAAMSGNTETPKEESTDAPKAKSSKASKTTEAQPEVANA